MVFFECDFCGAPIYRDHDWLTLEVNRPRATADALDRMGLSDAAEAVRQHMHFHSKCFEAAVGLLDDHRRWAAGSSEDLALGRSSLPRWELQPVPAAADRDSRGDQILRAARTAAGENPSDGAGPAPSKRCAVSGCTRWATTGQGRMCTEHRRAIDERSRRARDGTSVHDLDLPPGVAWLLWGGDVATVEELTSHTPAELLAIKQIGPKRVGEIVTVLAKRGLTLKAEAVHGVGSDRREE